MEKARTKNGITRLTDDSNFLTQTAPFLIRTFIKIGTFHRLTQFEDGNVPTADEQQIFTWCDFSFPVLPPHS